MALPEDEQRRLSEIERRLAEEDPRLVRRFDRQPMTAGTLAALISGAIVLLTVAVVVIVVGAGLGKPLVIVIGAVIAAVVPVMAWLARR